MISVEAKFNEAVASLNKAGLYDKFRKKFTNLAEASMEVKLNAALAVLKDAGIVESISEGGWALTFKPQPTIRKHNGPADNGNDITEAVVTSQSLADGATVDFMESTGMITESEGRKLRGEHSPDVADKLSKLTKAQREEFDFARLIGISESDAFTLVTITGGYNLQFKLKQARRF